MDLNYSNHSGFSSFSRLHFDLKLPAHLIPPLTYALNFIFHQKYQEVTMKHMNLSHFGTDTYTVFALTSRDKKCRLLPQSPLICSLPFSVKAKDSPNGLVLSVEPT